MTITYFPRISDAVASALIARILELDYKELAQSASATHPMVTYYATSVERVDPKVLVELRTKLVDLAHDAGFPTPLPKASVSKFDQPASQILDRSLDLFPAEAANNEVWNFLTLVLLPDLAKWRYPNEKSRLDFERWMGGHRNVFRKLWWREAVLGHELNSQIGEDEAVGIMERPGLASNPALARSLARALLATHGDAKGISRSDFMRKAMVNVRKRLPLVEFESFSEDELGALTLRIFGETAEQHNRLQASS
ncbi:hypothetical protein [Corynebacterium vitaeruminis]|uniref:hypothetical protein n=1 Tax=Corynebacterium vitaeruminis TaxID=38305 RepID=UPI0012DC556C|nr:hypothetical protein [Corynebacterium vitaeruminis]